MAIVEVNLGLIRNRVRETDSRRKLLAVTFDDARTEVIALGDVNQIITILEEEIPAETERGDHGSVLQLVTEVQGSAPRLIFKHIAESTAVRIRAAIVNTRIRIIGLLDFLVGQVILLEGETTFKFMRTQLPEHLDLTAIGIGVTIMPDGILVIVADIQETAGAAVIITLVTVQIGVRLTLIIPAVRRIIDTIAVTIDEGNARLPCIQGTVIHPVVVVIHIVGINGAHENVNTFVKDVVAVDIDKRLTYDGVTINIGLRLTVVDIGDPVLVINTIAVHIAKEITLVPDTIAVEIQKGLSLEVVPDTVVIENEIRRERFGALIIDVGDRLHIGPERTGKIKTVGESIGVKVDHRLRRIINAVTVQVVI